LVIDNVQQEAQRLAAVHSPLRKKYFSELESVLASSLDSFPSSISDEAKNYFPKKAREAEAHITSTLENEWNRVIAKKRKIFTFYSQKKLHTLKQLSTSYGIRAQPQKFNQLQSAQVAKYVSLGKRGAKVALCAAVLAFSYVAVGKVIATNYQKNQKQIFHLDSLQSARESYVDIRQLP
jgi:hypothetical protein